MTDTPERALLRRLMEARRAFHNGPSTPEKFAEWDAALAAADALLAQPALEGAKPQGPLKQYIRWPYVGEDGKWHIGELDVESPRVTRFFLDGALMKIAPEGNQCDGCRAGMPLHEGVHYRDDHPHICCTADRYTQPAPEGCEDDFHDELCDCNQTRPHLSRAKPAPEGVEQPTTDEIAEGTAYINAHPVAHKVCDWMMEMAKVYGHPTPPAARVEALNERFARLCRRVQETEHLADHTALESCEKCVALTDLYMALGVMDANYVRPTPLSRAEAEAMVEGIFRTIRVRTDGWTVQDTGRKETWNRLEYEDWQATTRAALLAALCGEKKP